MSEANVFDAEIQYDEDDPEGFRSGYARVGAAAGGKALAVKIYELPAGQAACPYHYEYEEEWLVVLEGEVLLRTPAGERTLGRGEVVCFPPGPEGAHKTSNAGAQPARILMFSSAREPAVAVYPDSDKVGVWPGREEDKVILHRADGQVDYWDGEH
jgi:uncharacterized cupin superfamily protein